jgi:hypothetical protein
VSISGVMAAIGVPSEYVEELLDQIRVAVVDVLAERERQGVDLPEDLSANVSRTVATRMRDPAREMATKQFRAGVQRGCEEGLGPYAAFVRRAHESASRKCGGPPTVAAMRRELWSETAHVADKTVRAVCDLLDLDLAPDPPPSVPETIPAPPDDPDVTRPVRYPTRDKP